MNDKTKYFTFRIEPEQIEQLTEIAKKEQRTVANLLRVLIADYIEQHKDK